MRQWEREFGRKRLPRKPVLPKTEPNFAEIKVGDGIDTQLIIPDTLTFRCKAFELRLPSDYPLNSIVRIIQTLEDGP